MKTLLVVVALFFGASFALGQDGDLAGAQIIRVWDLRISDLNAQPVEIDDPATIVRVVAAIKGAPAPWKKGSFRMPTGNLLIAFWRGKDALARYGLGERMLVRGSYAEWESKEISEELEALLSSLAQRKKPNQSLQPTAPSGRG